MVTLVFYKLNKRWWKEPALNVLAAAAQFSGFCHVELAIGSESGARGEMTNVSRVFNDDIGVELAARTGLNPQYLYVQLGCSKQQEERMLHFARSVVGMPFSNTAMARSVIWPRTSDYRSFFCAGTKAFHLGSIITLILRFCCTARLRRARRRRAKSGWHDRLAEQPRRRDAPRTVRFVQTQSHDHRKPVFVTTKQRPEEAHYELRGAAAPLRPPGPGTTACAIGAAPSAQGIPVGRDDRSLKRTLAGAQRGLSARHTPRTRFDVSQPGSATLT